MDRWQGHEELTQAGIHNVLDKINIKSSFNGKPVRRQIKAWLANYGKNRMSKEDTRLSIVILTDDINDFSFWQSESVFSIGRLDGVDLKTALQIIAILADGEKDE